MLRKFAPVFAFCLCAAALAAGQSSRHFTFHYAFTIKDVPDGAHVRVWFPQAHSDPYQEVRVISAKGDLDLKKTHESRFGNQMYYAEAGKAKSGELHFEVVYDVVRHEHFTIGSERPRLEDAALSSKESKEFLRPDKLVPVTGLPAELAAKATAGKTSEIEKAQAIYDYVFDNMTYDKSGTGWGRGDVLYACDAKKGNCTDFHSLFIAMSRSQGIPARFEIGFQIPSGKTSGEIAGYHCWAEFFDGRYGWTPVDISEAWKNPVKKSYFFGAHDANRVQFTIGRDLKLSPAQEGEPLNYFVYPYVEVGGKPYPNVSMAFAFADAEETVGKVPH